LLTSSAENWEENRRQNGDDSYDDEQFNERKSFPSHSFSPPFFLDFWLQKAKGEKTPSPQNLFFNHFTLHNIICQ
jgi:hypothetical protein